MKQASKVCKKEITQIETTQIYILLKIFLKLDLLNPPRTLSYEDFYPLLVVHMDY